MDFDGYSFVPYCKFIFVACMADQTKRFHSRLGSGLKRFSSCVSVNLLCFFSLVKYLLWTLLT